MSRLIAESTPDGLHISADELERAGIVPGMKIEVATLPNAREVQSRALGYVCWKLGDAIRVGTPEWTDGEWRVPLIAPLEEVEIGVLFVDPHGEVITAKAPTHKQLVDTLNAQRPSSATA